MLVKNSFKTLLVAGALALIAGGANAATFTPCNELDPDATSKLTVNIGCVGIGLDPASKNPDADDLMGMFGQESWTLIQSLTSSKMRTMTLSA
jgi:hypothetical protein